MTQADCGIPPTDWRSIDEVSLGTAPGLRPLLKRIEMPLDLSGRTVLHIGCGTGELLAEAARRGAARVVGVDRDPEVIRVARERGLGSSVVFVESDWSTPPEGQFDLVLWVDSLVREADPRMVLQRLRDRLAPQGLLILACQVHNGPGKQMMFGPDGNDSVYPTMSMVQDLLRGFAVRVIHRVEPSSGSAIEDWTFWCHARLPTVLLVRAQGNSGKSSLTQLLASVASQIVELDSTVLALRSSETAGSDLIAFTAAHAHPRTLAEYYEGVDEAGLTEAYVGAVLKTITPCDGLTIVEGYVTDPQADLLKRRLVERDTYVWDVEGVNTGAARAAALEQALAEQVERAAALEQALAEQVARAAEPEQALTEQVERAAELEQALTEQVERAVKLEQALNEQVERAVKLERALNEQVERAVKLEQALIEQAILTDSLLASRSWRLTSPARRAALMVRGGPARGEKS